MLVRWDSWDQRELWGCKDNLGLEVIQAEKVELDYQDLWDPKVQQEKEVQHEAQGQEDTRE